MSQESAEIVVQLLSPDIGKRNVCNTLPPTIGDGMGKNTGKIALLAAGYLLGKSKSIKTAALIAGGVAYGRLTAQQNQDDESSGSLLSQFTNSPELQRITSGLSDAARSAVSATASKGMESLNESLKNRSTALREQNGTSEGSGEDSEAQQDTDDSEKSDEASKEATESGGS